jgi:RNA polymerase sigma-70 factor (ECF subfamily)
MVASAYDFHPSSEQQLMLQVTKEDFGAFKRLFEKYYTPLCHHALLYCEDAAAAEDAVSDVFARLWEKRQQLNIEVSVKSYLYRAVANQCIDLLRKSYRKKVMLAGSLTQYQTVSEKTDLQMLAETRELAAVFENCIRKLPKQCGIIFRLSREGGMKYQEIANMLGISIKTVETQMSRAFKCLRAAVPKGHQLTA